MILRDGEILEYGTSKIDKAGRDQGVSSQIAEHADRREHKLARVDICVRIAFAGRVIVTPRNQAWSKIVPVADRIHLSRAVFFN